MDILAIVSPIALFAVATRAHILVKISYRIAGHPSTWIKAKPETTAHSFPREPANGSQLGWCNNGWLFKLGSFVDILESVRGIQDFYCSTWTCWEWNRPQPSGGGIWFIDIDALPFQISIRGLLKEYIDLSSATFWHSSYVEVIPAPVCHECNRTPNEARDREPRADNDEAQTAITWIICADTSMFSISVLANGWKMVETLELKVVFQECVSCRKSKNVYSIGRLDISSENCKNTGSPAIMARYLLHMSPVPCHASVCLFVSRHTIAHGLLNV